MAATAVPNAQNYNPYSGAPTPSRDEREDKAWRYLGYPTVAKLMGSSSDIFVLRRFDELHARVQLYSQDQIVRLEQELFQLDELCRRAPEDKFSFNNSIRPGMDPQPRRLEILAQLQFMLREYDQFVLAYSELRKRSTAQDCQIENLRRFFRRFPDVIEEDEKEFIDKDGDLIPIFERRKSLMRQAIERLLWGKLSSLFGVKEPGRQDRVDSEYVGYFSNQGFDIVMTFVVVVFGLGFLLGPIWWLNFVHNNEKRLGIISAFIVFFACILASATVEKRPVEVLAGTAAYAAVLMVYLQQGNPP